MPTEDTTGQGKLTVGKLYGGVLIYEIWKTTRFSNLEILAKMEEEMEEKEKLERGEIVEKPVPTPSEGEKTEKTEDTNLTNVTQASKVTEALPVEEELTEAKCDDRLKEIKDELDKSAQIPRDTSFDRFMIHLNCSFMTIFLDWKCLSGEWIRRIERSSDTTAACGTAGTAGITIPDLRLLRWLDTSKDTVSITLTLLLTTAATISLLKAERILISMRTEGCGVSSNTGSVYFPLSHYFRSR